MSIITRTAARRRFVDDALAHAVPGTILYSTQRQPLMSAAGSTLDEAALHRSYDVLSYRRGMAEGSTGSELARA